MPRLRRLRRFAPGKREEPSAPPFGIGRLQKNDTRREFQLEPECVSLVAYYISCCSSVRIKPSLRQCLKLFTDGLTFDRR